MNCPECGAEMKELFVNNPYNPVLGAFCYVIKDDEFSINYVIKDDEFSIKTAPVDVMWCPECGQIRGYLYKPSQEEK